MILMYHKIDKEAKTRFYVSVDDFKRQMQELSDKKVVTLDKYDKNNPEHIVITFDGVYENVYKYAFPVLKKYGYPFHLFITSDFIGKDNAFDTAEPLTKFATFDQLKEMAANGAILEWHTKTHRQFTEQMTDDEIISELTIPVDVKSLQPNGFKYFAFPFGLLSKDKLHLVKTRFAGALSVWQGNNHDDYKLNRLEVHTGHTFDKNSVFFRNPLDRGLISVVVPTYNVEAHVEDFFKSILSQTYKNLEIIMVMDAPTDNTLEIVRSYAKEDKRIKIIENEQNMGVAKTLCRGYMAATGDFCATMSPDDTIDMFYFENLIEKYKQTNSDVVCARMLASQDNYMFSDGTDFTFYPFAAKIGALFYFYPAMVRRKIIVENNIWNETMVERHWEDIIIRCKYAYYANRVSVATKAIRYYTIRKTSLSHAPTPQQLEYQQIAERRSTDFLHCCGIDDVRINIVGGFRVIGGWNIKAFFMENRVDSHNETKKKHHSFWWHLVRMKF